jgi:hypothetical protein
MKPVAYISEGGILFKESPPDSMIKLTPLYTALKDLTDDEILEVGNEIEPLKGGTMEQAFIYFARAILKKANEK